MAKTIKLSIIAEPIITHVANAKGGYDVAEVAFKEEDGKVNGKKLNSYFQKAIFPIVKELKRGDAIEVSIEKEAGSDGKEYWQWKDVRVLGAGEVASPVQSSGSPTEATNATSSGTRTASGTGRVTGSNYETPEERALRQVLIVRQSCLEQANKFLATTGEYTEDNLTAVAGRLYDWVFDKGRLNPPALNVPEYVASEAKPVERKKPAKAKEAQKAIDELEDDIPF